MITKFHLFEELIDNFHSSRRMIELILYFKKSIEEKEDELPKFFDENYPDVLSDWCINNSSYFLELEDYDTEDEAFENIVYPTTHYELGNFPEAEKAYKEFLVNIVDSNFKGFDYDDITVLPLYLTYSYHDDVEDDWLIHFTEGDENISSILKSQSFHGISDMKYLACTAQAAEDDENEGWVEGGYCFAFHIDDIDYNFKNGYSHYGHCGFLFKSSGIKLYHKGDDELQVIFIGNMVKNLIPFWYDSDTREFHDKQNTIRTDDFEEFSNKMIEKYG